jgi:hypothetical protein
VISLGESLDRFQSTQILGTTLKLNFNKSFNFFNYSKIKTFSTLTLNGLQYNLSINNNKLVKTFSTLTLNGLQYNLTINHNKLPNFIFQVKLHFTQTPLHYNETNLHKFNFVLGFRFISIYFTSTSHQPTAIGA